MRKWITAVWVFCTWVVTCLSLAYIALVLGFFILRLIMLQLPPALSLANSFLPFLFVPLAIVLPFSLFSRSRVTVMGAITILGIFMILYGSYFLPRTEPLVVEASRPLTLMNYNLSPTYPDAASLLAVIRAETPDIVALEELYPQIAGPFAEQSRELYPYRVISLEAGTPGLLSRYPILRSERLKLAGQDRPVLQATIDINGVATEVFAVHPPPPGLSWFRNSLLPTGLNDDEGESEINELIQRLANLKNPIVLLGDFNITDQSRAYAGLTRGFKDAYREAGWGLGFTFPNDLTLVRTRLGQISVPGPFVRLDYIFYSPDFQAQEAHVTCKSGSDHCYLVAQLTPTR